MNLDEANRLKRELGNLQFKKENGEEIHITIPNPDDSRYEGSRLKINKGRLEENSFHVLECFCKERKLTLKPRNGYLTIYTPKK
jgi:hypothetical protein